ncbi:hypothetical protein GPG13_08610 [Campylobacter jejuni]|nr:hypothetical protein [Campylobacter jejuni]EDO9921174.1 hypothetical protein [Campylobacter jejuni]
MFEIFHNQALLFSPFVPEGLRAEFSYILGIREGRNGKILSLISFIS